MTSLRRQRITTAFFIGLIGASFARAEEWAASDSRVREAIESFQPFWRPPESELRGWRVIISPAGGGGTTQETRDRDDLCLWTASHLYHLVRNAGGFPKLDRPDDRPAPADAERGNSRRELHVRILTAAQDGTAVRAGSSLPASGELAKALEAGGFRPAPPETAEDAAGVAVTVVLPAAADPRTATIEGIPAHRCWAERVYRGLAAYAKGRQDDREPAEGDEAELNPPVVPFYPRHATSTPSLRAAAAIWPEGKLPAEKARWFCDLYVRYAFSDRTNVHFEPDVTVDNGTVVVGGATSHTALQTTLETALKAAGCNDVRSNMRLLPEQGRLEADRWFGVCAAPMALTFDRPIDGGPLETQLLYGEPVFLLDRQDGFYLVQGGSDGYVGWVRENCVTAMTREQFKAYTDMPVAVLTADLAARSGRIVRGSRLRVAEVGDDALELALPCGERRRVARSGARLVDTATPGKARAKAALDLLNVPYLFGGRSSVGLDCSGLVGSMCDQFGCVIPRDAAQQFVTGSLVATRWFPEGLQPGDRIYFINEVGKIFHTALSLGGDYFVHSSPPGVQISSLKAGDRLYREHWDKHFLGARR